MQDQDNHDTTDYFSSQSLDEMDAYYAVQYPDEVLDHKETV